MSARSKLTLSYAAFLVVAGVLLLAVVWVFLLRYVPDGVIDTSAGFVPNRSDLVEVFVPAAAAVLIFLLVLGVTGGWFLAGRMLAPLQHITRAARGAAGGSLSHRIDSEGPPDEFRELADVFDMMLGRLEAHVAEQQRFAANASHELRTPLATTRALLDVARKDPDHDVPRLLARLTEVNDRAIGLTDALLLLSSADGGIFARDSVELSLLAEQAAETVLPLAEKRGVSLEVHADDARTIGSETLLLQMMTNLMHNSVVHNTENGWVRTRVAVRPEHILVVVENTGPVLSAELVGTLLEPFRRGSERTTQGDHAGVGLGLAIVQSIVRAHDGTLLLAPRESGGLVVTVTLPRTAISAGPVDPG